MSIAAPRLRCWLLSRLLPALALLALVACSHERPDAPSSALQAFRHGVEAYQEEDYPRAARLFEIAAAKDDSNAIIFYNLGLTYYMLEAYPEAIESYQKCIRLDPKFADAHMNLALAYDRTYDLEQANSHYNEYLKLVRLSKPRAADTASTKSATPVATAAVSPKQSKASMGGVPISSLPGGKEALEKQGLGDLPQQTPSSKVGQSRPYPNIAAERSQPQSAGRPLRSSTNSSTSSNAAQWWTQDTPSRNQ
jgi:tetratricopeptide (TPR) repeat protein